MACTVIIFYAERVVLSTYQNEGTLLEWNEKEKLE